jgi:hypothetical protein
MIPKVIFRYSWIYDETMKEMMKRKNKKYPSWANILKFKDRLEKVWRKKEKEIIKEIAKITNISWKEKYIHCYLVTESLQSFSEPLTLLSYKKDSFRKIDSLTDTLTHELIHRIFAAKENFQKSKKAWNYINKKYKKETWNTRVHVVIHAIHKHIFLKFFGEKRLEKEVQFMGKFKDYKRAWEIIQKEGYQNIINEFRKEIK